MSELETEARPILSPLIAGEARELDTAEQATLAAWGTKTAMMLDFIQAKPLVRSKEHAEFFASKRPPRNAHVWLAGYGPIDFLARAEAVTLRFRPPGSRVADLIKEFLVTYRIGHLVFQVTAPKIAFEFHRPAGHDGLVRAIWPPTGPVTMPPERLLQDEGELMAFSRPFEAGRIVYERPAFRAEPPSPVA